jgi:glutathione S-transferase
MSLELFVLSWGIYPRRALIYLAEKGLLNSPHLKITEAILTGNGNEMVAPGKPPGTLPILSLGNGQFIKQSIGVLEYFEDICDAAKSSSSPETVQTKLGLEGGPSMRGNTPEEKARTRGIMTLAVEATTHFGTACHKGTALWASLQEQDPKAARFAWEDCQKGLGLLEPYYLDDHRLEKSGGGVTIADCVLFSLLQFSAELYGRDLTEGFAGLKRFYNLFKERESAKIGKDFYPEIVKTMAQDWTV